MTLTPERLACLRAVASANGARMSHNDPRLDQFCDERSTLSKPDIFNQCHDAEWLISSHDDHMDISYVRLTDKGKAALLTATEPSGDKK